VSDLFGFFVVLTLVAAATSAVVAVLALRRRHVPGVTAFSAMMFAGAFWCAASAAELLAGTQAGKELWGEAAYVGIVVVAPSWLLFCLGYTGKLHGGVAWRAALLFVVPSITLVFALLGVDAGLVWSSARVVTVHGMDTLAVTHGDWFWVHTAYSYACLLMGAVVLLGTVLTQVKPLTSQGITIVLAVAMPWLANALTLAFAGFFQGIDLTPPSIVLSGALLVVGLSRFGALVVFPGMVPVARDAVLQGMRDGVLVVGRDGVILNANEAAARWLTVDARALAGRTATELIPGLERARAAAEEEGTTQHEYVFETALRSACGDERFVEFVVSRLGPDKEASGAVMAMRDVTERRLLEEELKQRALHDELTLLPNRALLREHLKELLALQRRNGGQVALLMLDLDRFKEINDTFGHSAGDEVLRTVAVRLRKALRGSDLVARLGGDEFAVVLPGCDAEHAVAVAFKLRDQVTAWLSVRERQVSVGTSVGVALGPLHGEDESTLLQHADVALYMAKDSPQGVAMYEAARDPNSPERLEFLADLRHAIENRDLCLYYQPVVHALSGGVARVEALARWPHPSGRLLEAREFIPLAEQQGLLADVTAWALDEALGQCREWQDAGWGAEVAVNLSAADLQDPSLVERVGAALSRHDVSADTLWVEITETSVMVRPERAGATLTDLRAAGVRISIDDFGVGHSSLAYVRALPAQELKIDRSFTSGAAAQAEDRAIVRAAVALGHDLGLTVTGEGVEDQAILDGLADLGCDCVQGYHIARPMPADEVLGWVRRRAGEVRVLSS
jgi:diguanylate cyclase (GGDEF)-like protein/PAS domain S-box-containing protein